MCRTNLASCSLTRNRPSKTLGVLTFLGGKYHSMSMLSAAKRWHQISSQSLGYWLGFAFVPVTREIKMTSHKLFLQAMHHPNVA